MNKMQRVLFSAASIALLANLFFYRTLGITGIACALLLLLIHVCVSYGKQQTKYSLVLIGWTAGISLLSVLRGTPLIQGLLLFTVFINICYLAFLFASQLHFARAVRDILVMGIAIPGSYLSAAIDTFFSRSGIVKMLPQNNKSSQTLHHLNSLLIGLGIGLPVMLILVALLSQADPIFHKTIQNLFSHITFLPVATRIIGSLIVFLFLVPWGMMSIHADSWNTERSEKPSRLLNPMIIVMTMVAITLGFFLVVQWPYVFVHVAKETDLSAFGVATYSEYVKKGFGEFLFVAGIVYALLWGGLLVARTNTKKKVHPLLIIQSVLMTLFFVYLLSIGRRIFLYWDFHGLSVVRVYGGMFLIWVGFLTGILWLRHFMRRWFVVAEVFGTLALVTFLGLWNAEGYIVANHPPTVNNHVDYVYLSRLSSDGYPGWILAYNDVKQLVNNNSDLQNKSLLNADDRREVAYAGIALSMVTKNYNDLVWQYGTKTEQEDYSNALFAQQLDPIQTTANLFSDSVAMLQKKGTDATVSADTYMPGHTGQDKLDSMRNAAFEIRSIASIAGQLAYVSGPKKVDGKTYFFQPKAPDSMLSFSQGPCQQFFLSEHESPVVYGSAFCIPSFYLLAIQYQDQPKTALDTFFTWNGADATAYQRLKKDISLQDLLLTQTKYLQLYKKILQQPMTERSVPQDISFSAPFVSSLR